MIVNIRVPETSGRRNVNRMPIAPIDIECTEPFMVGHDPVTVLLIGFVQAMRLAD